MTRVVLAVVLFAALAVVVWVVTRALTGANHMQPVKPDSTSSNAEWAEYYRRLAEDARRTGDAGSETLHNSMMQTYLDLDARNHT